MRRYILYWYAKNHLSHFKNPHILVYYLVCNEVVGWRYEEAFDETQKYKEGKHILERTLMNKVDWDST